METKHTPGPWVASGRTVTYMPDNSIYCYRLADMNDGGDYFDRPTMDANANLIAAAPSMLNTLQGITAGLAMLGECIRQQRYDEAARLAASLEASADAAIDQATGQKVEG